MALARVVYTQSVAENKNFTVPFPYISRDHVKVTVNGSPASFTWLNTNTVQIDPAPAVGAVVEIRRVTERRNLLVNFKDGSTITETDLDLLALQNFYLSQEADDLAEESNRIANAAANTVNNAIATANQASSNATSAVATANNAVTTANNALVNANNAVSTANNALSIANNASSNANAAVATAQQLETQFNNMLTSVQQIAGADLSDFAKNSDNLAFLTDKAAARANLGLGNVDNTSDLDKPVSLATQAALATKADVGHTHTKADITDLSLSWNDVTGKPSAFPPSAHTHTVVEVSGLGTAATRDVTTSPTDTTAGRVLKVGDFGVGAAAADVPGNNIDDHTIPTGFYYVTNTTSGTKPAGDDGYGHLIVSREGANGLTVRQLYMDNLSGRIWTRVRVPSQWSGWVEILHSGNLNIALNAPGAAPVFACRAWVNFNGIGTAAIRACGNVSSITDNGIGDYIVNFIVAMPDANYAVVGSCNFGQGAVVPVAYFRSAVQIYSQDSDKISLVVIR